MGRGKFMAKTKEATLDDLKKIFESIPPDELIKSCRMNSPFNFRNKSTGGVFCVRPEPKTELLSPDGKVLMRNGELVADENVPLNTFIGVDFGYKKSYSVPFKIVKEND